MAPSLVVLAKAPVPGRVKTRLCPPCTPDEAAMLAAAALRDTLAAAARAAAGRRLLVLEGRPGRWVPPGFEVVAQEGRGLAARLAAAFAAAGGPALLIGMDTPQVTRRLLDAGLERLADAPAVYGAAADGGYWAIGLRAPDPRVFDGVPMSRSWTGAAQLARLEALGLAPARLPALRDVDTVADARVVAALAPRGAFAAAWRELAPLLARRDAGGEAVA